MPLTALLLGAVLVLATLIDAFEVVLLPRPVRRRVRLNRYFFKCTWAVWAWCADLWPAGRRREDFIGVYGPLSMVMLFALWGTCLIVGFGLMHWALLGLVPEARSDTLVSQIIVSGDAFFTLGYGDNVPDHSLARLLVILEAGTGFGFIALTIGYLPVLYQHLRSRVLHVEQRFFQHVFGLGAKLTGTRPPLRLLAAREYANKGEALRAGFRLKAPPRWKTRLRARGVARRAVMLI